MSEDKNNWVILADIAKDMMTPNPQTVKNDQNITDAINKFKERKIGALPVIDKEGKPLGIISKTDIIKYDGDKNESVSKIMIKDIFSVLESSTTENVVTEMIQKEIHHVLVINESKELKGIISSMDILKKMYVSSI